jgi:hypothetical protein
VQFQGDYNVETNGSFSKEVNSDEPVLDQLVRRVRVAHRAVQALAANALAAALEAGHALIEIRTQVSGSWGLCLRANGLPKPSTARLYMQLARHRDEVEAALRANPTISLRAMRRLIAKPSAGSSSKPRKPELIAVLRKASDREVTEAFDDMGLERFFRTMPRTWREQITARVANLRTENGTPALKLTAALRKALSLVKTASAPGISPAVAESNWHEALATLKQFTVLLVRQDLDLNDLTITTTGATSKSRRRAA